MDKTWAVLAGKTWQPYSCMHIPILQASCCTETKPRTRNPEPRTQVWNLEPKSGTQNPGPKTENIDGSHCASHGGLHLKPPCQSQQRISLSRGEDCRFMVVGGYFEMQWRLTPSIVADANAGKLAIAVCGRKPPPVSGSLVQALC